MPPRSLNKSALIRPLLEQGLTVPQVIERLSAAGVSVNQRLVNTVKANAVKNRRRLKELVLTIKGTATELLRLTGTADTAENLSRLSGELADGKTSPVEAFFNIGRNYERRMTVESIAAELQKLPVMIFAPDYRKASECPMDDLIKFVHQSLMKESPITFLIWIGTCLESENKWAANEATQHPVQTQAWQSHTHESESVPKDASVPGRKFAKRYS